MNHRYCHGGSDYRSKPPLVKTKQSRISPGKTIDTSSEKYPESSRPVSHGDFRVEMLGVGGNASAVEKESVNMARNISNLLSDLLAETLFSPQFGSSFVADQAGGIVLLVHDVVSQR